MNEYLVVKTLEQDVYLYKIRAETANAAVIKSANEKSIKKYHFAEIYGNGGSTAIPYTIANLIFTYIKLFSAKAEVGTNSDKKNKLAFGGARENVRTTNFI